jgi:hypothetical protein
MYQGIEKIIGKGDVEGGFVGANFFLPNSSITDYREI